MMPTLTLAAIDALLLERFGLARYRPGQREVIAALIDQRAALAVFPTGGGKSLCYQLPALALEGVTVVVSPLIALMKDQIDFLVGRGIDAARLDSSLSPAESQDVTRRLRAGTVKLLYVAPERFNNERFVADLRRTRIALFAVDEAHCISEWGHNFRPDYLKLAETARALGAERVLCLTATATPSVVKDICAAFAIPDACAIVTGFYRPNLRILTTPVSARERDPLLLQRLRDRPAGPTILYVTLQRTAERIARFLANQGLSARAYHAGMEADDRSEVQEWWKASNNNIVVATIAFGMGIDKANVRYVYHYNLPKSLESYSQEIGRAGRDGEPAIVEMLACLDDVPALENFAYGDTPSASSLRGLVGELLDAGMEFDVALTDLSNRHDIRPLVLRTALTYLELAGALKQGTPFYAGYEVRPLLPMESILGSFDRERADFIQRLFAAAKKGRIWYGVRPDDLALTLAEPRERIRRALQYLEEQQWIELRAAEVRQRYSRLDPGADAGVLAEALARRFARREQQEVARLASVLALIASKGCQCNALVAHFGEQRTTRCGHCSFCEAGEAVTFTPVDPGLPINEVIPSHEWESLRGAHPTVLHDTRSRARFLCGLASPAFTRAKLGRHPLFGVLAERRFADVMAWCEQ